MPDTAPNGDQDRITDSAATEGYCGSCNCVCVCVCGCPSCGCWPEDQEAEGE